MVPVELRLRNFLSYGEAAPPLAFEGLRVACLSGGNGQGKSALLDAITWALWGEARKSADNRKPDEELLRIGAREMEVDLSFKLDDTLYRIARRFTQTASGKSSKPGLEFQVRDGDGWRALTAESVRATQAAIDARLGIDYETFVNSTFLLQGRSDEFTKKKPGERKEILGKILGLDRYDRLAQRAGVRWTGFRDAAARLEADAERLTAALGDVAAWQAERDALAATIATCQTAVAAARADEAAAAETLAALDAAAREADTTRAARAALVTRLATLGADLARLDGQMADADALVARAASVEADHAAFEALRAERTALDERAGLHRGLDAQRQALVLEIEKAKNDAQNDLTRREMALTALERQVTEATARLAVRPRTVADLQAATVATQTLRELDAVRSRRQQVLDVLAGLEKALAAAQGTLEGHVAGLRAEHARLTAALAAAPAAADGDALRARVADGRAAEAEMDRVRDAGTARAADVQALDAGLARLADDLAALDARAARLGALDGEDCPTCGTALTESHRAHVAATYAREREALAARQAADRAARDAARAERDALRDRFLRLKASVADGQAAAEALAALDQRATQRAADDARRAEVEREGRAAGHALKAGDFGHETRARIAEANDALADLPFDEARYTEVRRQAEARERLARELSDLDAMGETLAQNEASAARQRQDVEQRREALARGDHAAAGRQQLERLAAQIARVGYDAQRHERVALDLDRLAGAPAALAALLTARRTLAEGAERRASLRAEQAAATDEDARLAAALDALAERLAERDAARARRDDAAARATSAAADLSAATAHCGALDERLARAAADRERLDATRRDLREAKTQRALYGHLRRAFSKNGIPALIVEETLPEVEERANQILERLSGGRTRVALETLKDKKTGGGTKETLDIRITDAEGQPRAYEMYSGGEAFRVNFALRIALAQMLAERSGTRIRTLVVDEGFGTQDKDGLQALVGAIRAIQDDFDLILVITHLDELKAAFPVRIEVRKEPVTGSTFEIVGD